MSFPLDYRGELSFRKKTALAADEYQQELLQSMAAALEKVDGGASIQDNRIRFTGGLFRMVSNMNILAPITDGYVDITVADNNVIVTYYLRFTQILVAATLFSLIIIGLTLWNLRGDVIVTSVCFLAAVWTVTFGFNILGSIVHFGSFIERTLQRV